MSYGKILSHPVGDANSFNYLSADMGGGRSLYGIYTENSRVKRPISAFPGCAGSGAFLAYPITFRVNRGEVAWLDMG